MRSGMYKKIRNHLTILCTISTAAILLLMVFICLFFVEKQIKVRAEAEFSRDMNAVLYYIRSQRVMDHTWLSQMEKENHLLLYIENEHTPLFYTQLKDSGERKMLFDKIRKKALAEQFDITVKPDKHYQDSKVIFSIEGENRKPYFGGAAVLPLEEGYFGILIAKDRGGRRKADCMDPFDLSV